MAAEKGRVFVLKIGDGASSETFTDLAGARSTSLTINGEMVDITNKGSAGYRELLEDGGVSSMSISQSGVFFDSADEVLLQTAAKDMTLNNYELLYESGDKWSGAFQVTSYENGGEHNDAVTYSCTLESSGVFTFTAV